MRPTLFMLMARVGGSSSASHVRSISHDGRIAHRVAAAAHAELSGHRGQREHRRGGTAAVAIALEAPAAFHQRRRGLRVSLGELSQLRGINAADFRRRSNVHGCAFSRSSRGAIRVLVEKGLGRMSLLEEIAVNRQRHGKIGAGPHRQVKIGLARQRRCARIDHHDDTRRCRGPP